jgi:hypothetical protein
LAVSNQDDLPRWATERRSGQASHTLRGEIGVDGAAGHRRITLVKIRSLQGALSLATENTLRSLRIDEEAICEGQIEKLGADKW